MPRLIAVASALFLALWIVPANADDERAPLNDWRNRLSETRTLAENDPTLAYRNAERLQAAIPSDATPADRVRALNVLSRSELYLAQSDDSTRHARLALDAAQRNDDKVGQVEADLNLAINAVNQGRIDLLTEAVTHAMSQLEGVTRPDLAVEALLHAAAMYNRIGERDSAMSLPVQALEIARRSNDARALALAHQGMAFAIGLSGRWEDMQNHYEEMRNNARTAHSRILEIYAQLGIGSALTEQRRFTDGEAAIRESVEMAREFKSPFYLAQALFTLADNLKAQGHTGKALTILDEVVAINETHANRIGLWWTLDARSTGYQAAGRFNEAVRDARRAQALAKEIGLPVYAAKSARRLAALAAASGDYRNAYALSVKAVDDAEDADRKRAAVRIADLAQRYRNEARQQEIEDLKRRNERHGTEQRWLWTLIAAGFVVSASLVFALLRSRRWQREIRALNQTLEQRVHERTAELRQQARYLNTLVDMLPMWTWFKDTNNRYLVTNRAHADAAGYTVGEMIGKADADLSPLAPVHPGDAGDAEVIATRGRKTTEEHLACRDGSRWMEIYRAAVVDEDGTVLGTVGVARDISERKADEEARNAALAEAERLARLRSEFIAQLNHELRTPLNGILGYAQILSRNAVLHGRDAAGLAIIRQNGEQLLSLVNDILELAKIEAGKSELRPGAVPLQAFVRGIRDIVALQAAQKGLPFFCEMDASLPETIQVDERRLRQVLLNLISNAIRFTDSGKVTLSIRCETPTRLRFAVEDTGVGIAGDQLESMFRPFERTGERRDGGTGLGLAISRQLVESMGSEIHVSSTPGKGSTFWFELYAPHIDGETAAPSSHAVISGYAGPRKRVLSVAATAMERQLFVDLLDPIGFETIEADDRDVALAVRNQKPDLVLICIPPTGSGTAGAIRELRASEDTRRIPIVAISPLSADVQYSKGIADADALLLKPVRLDVLLDRIGKLLGLEWVRSSQALPENELPNTDGLPLPPPQEELAALHRAALLGDMRDIRQRADALLKGDERYRPFARRLYPLAERYQSKLILNLLERYLSSRG